MGSELDVPNTGTHTAASGVTGALGGRCSGLRPAAPAAHAAHASRLTPHTPHVPHAPHTSRRTRLTCHTRRTPSTPNAAHLAPRRSRCLAVGSTSPFIPYLVTPALHPANVGRHAEPPSKCADHPRPNLTQPRGWRVAGAAPRDPPSPPRATQASPAAPRVSHALG